SQATDGCPDAVLDADLRASSFANRIDEIVDLFAVAFVGEPLRTVGADLAAQGELFEIFGERSNAIREHLYSFAAGCLAANGAVIEAADRSIREVKYRHHVVFADRIFLAGRQRVC